MIMVPAEEFNRLSSYYQGKITESTLLNKAGRLAAEQQLILEDKSIPDSLAVSLQRGISPYHDFNPQRGLSPFHDVISQFVRLTLLLVAGDVTIPSAFIGSHFEFICHPWWPNSRMWTWRTLIF